jgi:hypothetical protein
MIAQRPKPVVGELVELARYSTSQEARGIYGQRINGKVRVTDRPLEGHGRAYLIERELERDGLSALNALVADYLQQATALDGVPMSGSAILRKLQQDGAR